MNFVIDTETGEVKRYGKCDFENDGSFDASTETMVNADLPEEDPYEMAWNGSALVFDLDSYKKLKCAEFDLKNIKLRQAGALYSGYRFTFKSASNDEIKANWIGAYGAKAGLSYPYKVKTSEKGVRYSVTDAEDFDALYTALFFYANWVVSSSGDLEEQVAACSTKAEVDAITDTRTPDTPYE